MIIGRYQRNLDEIFCFPVHKCFQRGGSPLFTLRVGVKALVWNLFCSDWLIRMECIKSVVSHCINAKIFRAKQGKIDSC